LVAPTGKLRPRDLPQGRAIASVKVRLPALLASHAGGRRDFTVEAATVSEALAAARDTFPELRRLLDDEDGRRRPHVRVFYNELDEESIDGDGPATDRDEIMIIQAVSGGAH
jgi:molybdopterin converting factor small subunit